jgi:hypothetical protein
MRRRRSLEARLRRLRNESGHRATLFAALKPVMDSSDSPCTRNNARETRRTPASLAALALSLVVGAGLVAYSLWYTSSGRFPSFPDIQNDYVDLGQSFLRGDLALPERPDPLLAELGNPYDYSQRKGIPYHWDASYFEGRYYLYWGPAPALVSGLTAFITGSPLPASVLVLIPYLGLIAVLAVLLWYFSSAFEGRVRYSIGIFILIGFFNLPMLFTIGQPRHYQASILFGQFFLLSGLLAWVLHTRDRRLSWLVLAGLAWGLAFASRYNLAISIAIYMAGALLWFWRYGRENLLLRSTLVAGGLGLCLLGLGLYNLTRFGNAFETGLTYQLTIPEFGQINYSRLYVPSGLYIYLLYPLSGSQTFPFIQSAHFTPRLLPPTVPVPPGREFDQIAFGLLPTVPALWLLALAIPLAFWFLVGKWNLVPQAVPDAHLGFATGMLAVAAAAQWVYLLFFFYVAERYIVDFYLPVVLLLALVVWSADRALERTRILQGLLWTILAGLTLWTVAIGYFACFGVPVLVSLYYDPQMLDRLATFWNAVVSPVRSALLGL